MHPPQAILLLGGKGTRIAALYPDLPKALIPVAGRPFLEHQLLWLLRGGIRRIHLAAGVKADRLCQWLAAPRPPDLAALTLTLTCESAPLGTGGALPPLLSTLPHDSFLILNGDSLCPNLDFSTRWNHFPIIGKKFPYHGKNLPHCGKPLSTEPGAWMFVTPVENAARFGTVDVDPATGDIRAFREKAAVDAGLVNAGIYLIPRAFIAEIPLNRPVSIETELFPRWAAEHRLRALFAPSPLLDMGTPDGLAQTNDFLQNQLSTFHPEESP